MSEALFNYRFSLATIVALACYQVVLCFLNTHGISISNNIVAATEACIVMAVTCRVLPRRPLGNMALLAFLAAYFAALWAMRGETDTLGPRNILIILVFFWLGQSINHRDDANKIVWYLSTIVLFFGFFEYAFTDTYLKQFDILHYYMAREMATESDMAHAQTNVFISGIRPGGRNLLPFLGDLRVSSVFLEPVSMGNYAVIVGMWALSFDRQDWRKGIGHFIVAVVLVIASDSRFASMILFLLMLVRLFPLTQKPAVLLLLPVLTLSGLMLYTHMGLADARMDDLSGRLMRTGETLIHMDILHIFGLDIPEALYDSGIPYSLEIFGLLLVIILWIIFAAFPICTEQGMRFRAMLAVYCLGLLLISGTSFYSSKTAAILWLLMGVSYRNPGKEELINR